MNDSKQIDLLKIKALQASLTKAENELRNLTNEFCKKYCSFKPGDRVYFSRWGNKVSEPGIVDHVYYDPGKDAIEGFFKISVKPANKGWSLAKRRYNVIIGRFTGSVIQKA